MQLWVAMILTLCPWKPKTWDELKQGLETESR